MAASSPAPSGGHVSLSAAGMAQGARAALPLAFAAGCFAATLGVLASTRGVSGTELTLMSVLVFAGAAQVVAVELWGPSLPVLGIVLATLAINSRHVLLAMVGATLVLGALRAVSA